MPPSSATAYNSLTAFKPRESKDVMGEAEQKYDIAGRSKRLSSLRGLVGNLQSSVEAVDPSVTGRTSGNFTTEAQRLALVNREQAPILGSLAKEQQALGVEQAGYSDAQNLAGQMASALMQDDQRTYQRLLDQYNTAKAAEDTAEQIRQTQASLAESRRQFDEQQRTAKASASGSGYDLSSIAKYLTTPKATESNDDRYKKWLATQLSVKPISSLVVSGSKNNKVQGSNVKLQGGGPALQSGGIKLQGKGATTQKLITKPSTSRLRVT